MCALGIFVFILGRLVHWSAPLGSSSVDGLIVVRPEFTAVAWFIDVRPEKSRGHPGSLRLLSGVIRYVWGHWGTPWDSSGSSGVPRFIGVRPGVRRVRTESLVSLGCALGLVRFIRGRWVHY